MVNIIETLKYNHKNCKHQFTIILNNAYFLSFIHTIDFNKKIV